MNEELIEISDDSWKIIRRVLTLIAKQIPALREPDLFGWFAVEEIRVNQVLHEKCVCLICEKEIVVIGNADNRLQERLILRNHGFNHLKERNLAPFL